MAQPPVTGHFWDPDVASYDAIITIKDFGTEYTDEDVTWGAWEEICRKYFPQAATSAFGVKYQVRRDAYRALPPQLAWQQKPDVVVVNLSTPQPPQPGPDGLVRSVKRDILWVECKAPSRDQPGEWQTVMDEATKRLDSAHPTRNVWLILAIGLKWMVFYWDPQNAANNPLPLSIISANSQGYWPVDSRIRVAPINGQRHIDFQTGVIHTGQANSLDFWTMAPAAPNQPAQPANLQSCMLFLEQIVVAIQTGVYNGANPGTMS